MVKLSWLEEVAICIIVAGITLFFFKIIINLVGFDSFSLWVWAVLWLIVYGGISSIVVKVIKGKDAEKENKTFKTLWKKLKTWEKVIITIIIFVWIIMVFGAIFGV